ncbi:MAG: polysaccharide biosynthesis protein [Patescibacteria group bacterium]|jgi:UDP-glucose 4-epimerase
MNGTFTDKTIVITGGTGSLGKVLVRRILGEEMGRPRKIIVFSRDEAKQYQMLMHYESLKNSTEEIIYQNYKKSLQFRIGDVRNYHSLSCVLRDVDIVIHAAALKIVPNLEIFPYEGILTNCEGSQNIITAIHENKFDIETVIGISTDKAVHPENAYGAMKLLMERLLISANLFIPNTKFVLCRYGNVLDSRGSVIPLFHEQILKNIPITITTKNMTRFLLPLLKGVDTIHETIKNGLKGEIIVPKVPASKILDIAELLIEHNKKLEIKEIGIRQGEKINEILISEEEAPRTYETNGYYHIQPMLPELTDKKLYTNILKQEYSSKDFVMSKKDTKKLLEENHLLYNKDYYENNK